MMLRTEGKNKSNKNKITVNKKDIDEGATRQ